MLDASILSLQLGVATEGASVFGMLTESIFFTIFERERYSTMFPIYDDSDLIGALSHVVCENSF